MSKIPGPIGNFLDSYGKNSYNFRSAAPEHTHPLVYQCGATGELEIRLAPLYDVVSTAYYPELSQDMAMRIGAQYSSEKSPSGISRDWPMTQSSESPWYGTG